LAEQALEGARIETVEPERSEAMPALDGVLDLILMDADAAGPELTREVIEALAGRKNGPGVLLIGAHLSAGLVRALLKPAGGAAHAYLGGSCNLRLAEASRSPERIDAAVLGAFAYRVDAGFDLFAAPRDPMAFDRVSSAAVLRVLEMACQGYESVIVDLPHFH